MPITAPRQTKRRTAPKATTALRDVVVLAYDGLCTFEFGVAVEIFGLPRPEMGDDWYRLKIAATEAGPLRGLGGIVVTADGGLGLISRARTIVVPGWKGIHTPVPADLARALRTAAQGGARFVSICSGAFVLAGAGLLDGRRATTHWRYAKTLAAMHPSIEVQADVLYVEDGPCLTSAGSAAGIDACLHLIRRDFGTDAANHVARRLVVPAHRPGGQAQYIEQPLPSTGAPLNELFDWMRERLHEDLTLERLADQCGMSRRTFVRRFKANAGKSPGEWLVIERLERAKTLLEAGASNIDRVAEQAGFGSAPTLRHHFRERLGTTPTAYRAQFSRPAPASVAPKERGYQRRSTKPAEQSTEHPQAQPAQHQQARAKK